MPKTHVPNAQRMPLPSMRVPATDALLAGVRTSNGGAKPITCGFFRMEKGQALVYDDHCDEKKVIVEGGMTIADENGQSVTALPGDVFYFAKGGLITFSSPSYGVGLFCGQRQFGEA